MVDSSSIYMFLLIPTHEFMGILMTSEALMQSENYLRVARLQILSSLVLEAGLQKSETTSGKILCGCNLHFWEVCLG